MITYYAESTTCQRIDNAHRNGDLTDAQRKACDRGHNCNAPTPKSHDVMLDERIAELQRDRGMTYKDALIEAAYQLEERR